ncbi:MAG: right-handed parallel beta-helix repeat-containing protein [Kiritimatiellae bacterium]|nr:right-handed parallel beta-helix repeat-containing protein [Kiritimatiellia bacterium]MDD5521056.1 right-handed parallel beta-helix repeat-containing protein [Kiritimatiellia bacterium]
MLTQRLLLVGFLSIYFMTGSSGIASSLTASNRTLYVNNVTGNDNFDGLKSEPDTDGKTGPFATIGKAFASVCTSDHIEIANTGRPYKGRNGLVKAGGTADKPLLVNGNGALISGLDRVPKEKWNTIRKGIVATKFWPMSNMLKGYEPIQYWIGTPQIWWLDGKPAPNCTNEEELNRTKGGFYWNKPQRQLWVHLPAGKTLDDVIIQIPVHGTAICISTDFVTVRNLRAMFSWNDGFDMHGRGKNTVFQHCIATDNCGQGFSVHDTNVALYEDCLAERNASSGSCDVNECHSVYRRCVFVNNSFEAGVYANEKSHHTYEDCLIVGNLPFEQIWQRHFSSMNFLNCVIAGVPRKPNGLILLENGMVHFRECTFADALFVFRLSEQQGASVSIVNSILTRCSEPFLTISPAITSRIRMHNNVYFAGTGIKLGERVFGQNDWGEYQKISRLEQDSIWQDPKLGGEFNVNMQPDSPVLALRQKKPFTRIGAVLPDSVWDLYNKTRGDVATPNGIIKAR